jgi:UDP-glucuronate 4-epimerase
MRYIEVLEQTLGRPAMKRFLPMQPGDVQETWADIEDTVALTGYQPRVSIEEGVPAFVEWYRTYYRA